MTARFAALLLASLVATGSTIVPTSAASSRAQSDRSGFDPAVALASLVSPAPPARQALASFSPITFDDFNRTVASGWGTSSSGVDWTDDSFRQNGITSEQAGNAMSMDGLNGRMDLGVGWAIYMRAGSGPWEQPAWTMTTRFKASAVPASDYLGVSFYVDGLLTPGANGVLPGAGAGVVLDVPTLLRRGTRAIEHAMRMRQRGAAVGMR